MDASEYERVTSEIANSVFAWAEGFPSENVRFGRRSKWKGQSEFVHQIDVAIQGQNDIIMVECKHLRDKSIHAEHILTFIARINDIRSTLRETIHPVFVACNGFQSGCRKLATFYKLDLTVVSSPGNFAFSYKGMKAVGRSPAPARLQLHGLAPTAIQAATKNRVTSGDI